MVEKRRPTDGKENEMNAYLIDNHLLQVLGRYATVEDAERVAEKMQNDFSILTEERELAIMYTASKLVKMYNQLTGEDVKRFSETKVGAKRLWAKMVEHQFPIGHRRSDKPASAERAESTRRSWQDEAVKEARSARYGVKVGAKEYKSVREAFEELGLPMAKHAKFRKVLVTAKQKKAEFNGQEFVLVQR